MRHTLALALALFAAAPVRAAIIDQGTTLLDTDTGITWLKLTAGPVGTYDEAVDSSWYEDGWRHATEAQICGLLDAFSLPCEDDLQEIVIPVGVFNFVDLVGYTAAQTMPFASEASIGIFAPQSNDGPASALRVAWWDTFEISPPGSLVDFREIGRSEVSPGIDHHFLVLVPEPSTALLVALGVVGIGVRRRAHS